MLCSYCLDKLPATFDEYVSWLCEDCKQKVGKTFSLDKPSIPSRLSLFDNSKEMQASEPMIRIKKNGKESIRSTAKKDAQMRERSSSLHDALYSENIDMDKFTKKQRPDFKEKEAKFVKTSQVAVSYPNASDLIEYDSNYVDSQPIIDPIWR